MTKRFKTVIDEIKDSFGKFRKVRNVDIHNFIAKELEEDRRPRFEDLSNREVNDLLASEVMKWISSQDSTGAHIWKNSEGIQTAHVYDDVENNILGFKPYASLDDCRLIENQMDHELKRIYIDFLFITTHSLVLSRPSFN